MCVCVCSSVRVCALLAMCGAHSRVFGSRHIALRTARTRGASAYGARHAIGVCSDLLLQLCNYYNTILFTEPCSCFAMACAISVCDSQPVDFCVSAASEMRATILAESHGISPAPVRRILGWFSEAMFIQTGTATGSNANSDNNTGALLLLLLLLV